MSATDSAVIAQTAKQQVLHLLEQLPDDCTIEDVQYGLFVLEKIREGLDAADRGDLIPHEEVKKRLQKWAKK